MLSLRRARIALALLLGTIYATLGSVRIVSNALRDAGLLRLTVGVIFVTLGAAVIAVLARRPELRTPRALLGAVGIAAAYLGVILAMDSPEEKLHFIEYGAVALLAFASFPPRWPERRRFLSAACFTTAAGWIDEGIQALLPTRFYDLRDVGFNAAAGVMALTAFALLRLVSRERASLIAQPPQ